MNKTCEGPPLADPHRLKIYQPVSRILYPGKPGWSSFIWLQHYCYNLAAYPPASDEPPSIAGICGITAHKVYPISALLQKPVSSYLTFSTLLPSCHSLAAICQERSGNFLWPFLFPVNRKPALNRYVALCCPDFPHPVNRER